MYNVYGVFCSTWDEACEVAGIETPAQLAAEEAYWAAKEAIEIQDAMEARGGPLPRSIYEMLPFCNDIPF
jgi:hypothetical protein